jgi:predicted DNA-binding protein
MTVVKTSFNLSEESLNTLEEIAKRKGVSKADIVRKAIATFKFLDDKEREGGKILIEEKDHSLQRVIFR